MNVSRNELKGIAIGLATKFMSRNNDLDGYWAIGILYKDIKSFGYKHLKLKLIPGLSEPELDSTNDISAIFRLYLYKQIKSRGFNQKVIPEAIIELRFENNSSQPRIDWLGKTCFPFSYKVIIIDDLHKTRFYEVSSYCREHNSTIENRR